MIISASRRTDIPAYFSDWFFQRIKERFVLVRNPMNLHQVSQINLSPEVVDCIVFWTKNPKPMLDRLDLLRDYSYYFQFTLTSYGKEIEAKVPSKSGEVIETFQRLSDAIGKERVIWRYDPIFITEKYSVEYHEHYFEKLTRQLNGFTEKCTVSFLDDYPSIQGNLASLQIQSLTAPQKIHIAELLSQIAGENGLQMDSCAEEIDLNSFGIGHASCIDETLIRRLIGCPILTEKDKHQRPACGCAASIDIGAYHTCQNECRYCYANHSKTEVMNHVSKYEAAAPLLCSRLTDGDKVSERSVRSLKDHQLNFL